MIKTLTADRAARLDVLAAEGCGVTRSRAAKWIADGLCEVNGAAALKAGTAVKPGDTLRIRIPEAAPATMEKENIPVTILYQDGDIAVIDKPYGMVVHPAGGNETGTLVNALLYALDGLSGIGGVQRPGIVHRLDKDTSGIMLVAKNDQAHLSLSKQLKDRTIEKHYLAVVEGDMKEDGGLIDQPIGRSKRDRKKNGGHRGRQAVADGMAGAGTSETRHAAGRANPHGAHASNPRAYAIRPPSSRWRSCVRAESRRESAAYDAARA